MTVDIVTIHPDEPFDPAAAQAELDDLRRQVAARLVADVANYEAAQAAAAQLDAITIESDQEARHAMPVILYLLVFALLGMCCGAGGVLALAYWLGR